jgi:hypothetical protein
MKMVAFYLPRGHNLDHLLNLSYSESLFYHASMEKFLKDEEEKYSQLFRGGE